jgi:hypothetical protein
VARRLLLLVNDGRVMNNLVGRLGRVQFLLGMRGGVLGLRRRRLHEADRAGDRALKLPVNAASDAGDVKTVVCAAELLVIGAKTLPLVPASLAVPSNGAALNVSPTEGMTSGIGPLGTLIDRLALVEPAIVLPEFPRFSARN